MIHIAELEDETFYEYSNIDANELKLKTDRGSINRISAKVKINKSSIGLRADFHVHFTAHLTCSRCLNAFTKEFDANLYINYVEGKDPYANVEKVHLKTDDIDKIYYSGSQIDLGVGIREAIMLTVPISPLCSEQCHGLCPVCGKNRNEGECKCEIEKVELFTPSAPEKKEKRKRRKKK